MDTKKYPIKEMHFGKFPCPVNGLDPERELVWLVLRYRDDHREDYYAITADWRGEFSFYHTKIERSGSFRAQKPKDAKWNGLSTTVEREVMEHALRRFPREPDEPAEDAPAEEAPAEDETPAHADGLRVISSAELQALVAARDVLKSISSYALQCSITLETCVIADMAEHGLGERAFDTLGQGAQRFLRTPRTGATEPQPTE